MIRSDVSGKAENWKVGINILQQMHEASIPEERDSSMLCLLGIDIYIL